MPKTRTELKGTGGRIAAWLTAALERLDAKGEDLAMEVARSEGGKAQRLESLQRSIANYLKGTDIPLPRAARSLGAALQAMGHPHASELSAVLAAGHLGVVVLCFRWIAVKEYVYGEDDRRKRGNFLAAILCNYVPLAVEADIISVALPELSNKVTKQQAEVNLDLLEQGQDIRDCQESDAEHIIAARELSGGFCRLFKSEIHAALDLAEAGETPPLEETDESWNRGLRMGAAVQSLVDGGAGHFEDKLDLLWVAMPVWANALQGIDQMRDDGPARVIYQLRSRVRLLS